MFAHKAMDGSDPTDLHNTVLTAEAFEKMSSTFRNIVIPGPPLEITQ